MVSIPIGRRLEKWNIWNATIVDFIMDGSMSTESRRALFTIHVINGVES